ncbi:glycoside hydrolase family 27 protein [Niabella sp. CC-SYL272]|uniref:glycoside hydrolase family 27 protein n=1 Tax=Niabella agricola TaxID=2891571 RepID=UPI001F16EDA6|nr:glycoside hydrolase family 27 protein [Niabella agricola]MCF3108173.1 glycoside hydrolase family 27 protein [Niabella agricola]
MKKGFLFAFICVSSLLLRAQKFEGLAPTPPMGWNSWNIFGTDINEEKIRSMADLLVSTGMKEAGYTYLVLDDGWMAGERDSITGNLVADPKKFPHGMKAIGDYIHAKGLKFGIYNCAGTKTCQGLPGTRGYEYQDARLYAAFGVDYLKFDWCNTSGIQAAEAYTTMSNALRKAGRPMLFSICEWGVNRPWEWAGSVGQLWRTTEDIWQVFDGYHDYGTWKAWSVMTIADQNGTLRKYAGPGHWNDPDMLEVGNGMSLVEDKTHFALWAMMAAPLMLGNDLRKMNAQTAALLTNRDVIAIDQDTLGIQGFKYSDNDSVQTWFKPLQHGDWAVCFLNRGSKPKEVYFYWKSEPVNDTLFHQRLDKTYNYRLQNVWTGTIEGNTSMPYSGKLQPHEAALYRLKR